MGLFNRGDDVTVVRNNYPEEGSKSFVGSTGQVAAANDNSVIVRIDGESRSYGFDPDEVERTR